MAENHVPDSRQPESKVETVTTDFNSSDSPFNSGGFSGIDPYFQSDKKPAVEPDLSEGGTKDPEVEEKVEGKVEEKVATPAPAPAPASAPVTPKAAPAKASGPADPKK